MMRFSELERSRVLSIVERNYLAFSYILNDRGLKPCVTITVHSHDH